MAYRDGAGYFERVGHAVSHLVNALLGGKTDETSSSRIGRYQQRHGELPWYVLPVAFALEQFDPGHLERAVKNENRR